MDPNMKKLHNAVFVSDKIVTYKLAAGILETNANEAKKVLERYVNEMKSKNEVLNVSHIVGGITHEKTHKIKLVSHFNYGKTKSQFKTITIDHIFAIQKAPFSDWSCVANVDDFLYDEKTTATETKAIKPKSETTEVKKEIKTPQKVNKKGALTSFLNNAQKKTENKTNPPKKTIEKSKKQENKAFTNFFSKNNRENVGKVSEPAKNGSKKESDDEDDMFKVNKKCSRVINDDDDDMDQTPSKCAKTDILDDPDEADEDHCRDEDLFGTTEKDEEMKDAESTEVESDAVIEKFTETTDCNSEQTEKNTEKSDIIYEDEDGYFVTEKKTLLKQKAVEKQLTKKEIEEKKKIEKQERKTKKGLAQKIKKNTNQKTLLNFFQKK